MPYGTDHYGTRQYGGMFHLMPLVVVTAPTSGQNITTGPLLTVSWTYTQENNDPQAFYRIEFTDNPGVTEYYDTGWLAGAITSTQIDLSANNVPMDSTNVSVRVSVRSSMGVYYQTVSTLVPFNTLLGVVTCTITAPTPFQVINTPNVTVSWTFSSTRGFTQQAYRVRLLTPDGSVVFFDSGWTPSSAVSLLVPYQLNDGSSYEVGVRLKNTQGALS